MLKTILNIECVRVKARGLFKSVPADDTMWKREDGRLEFQRNMFSLGFISA